MTQKETEDVIAKVMRTDSLRAEIVDQVIIKSIFFIKTTHTHTHTHTQHTQTGQHRPAGPRTRPNARQRAAWLQVTPCVKHLYEPD